MGKVMLYWALVEQARHEHMSDEYKDQYLVYYYSVVEAPILGLSDKYETTTVGSPTELVKGAQVKLTNTDLPNTYRRSTTETIMHPIGQIVLLITYRHFGNDFFTGGGRGLCGGPGKGVDGVFSGRPQSFRHQRRPVDDCSPGRGGIAQNGGTRGGTFHGKMDRCRESQGWTTACSRMPERDGKDQGEDSPKQAGSCWFARPC